jgi:Uma2 family endonuclease
MSTATMVTPEELLEMPDGHHYELIDGELVERNMGAESSRIAQLINQRTGAFADTHHLGLVWGPDCGYQIFSDDPDRVRYPDGSFIASGRLPGDEPPRGHVRIAPDLALEVVSPNDLAWKVDEKVQDYLDAGVHLVWVVFPDTRAVFVYRADADVKRLTPQDHLSGEDILPGFSVPVAELFPKPVLA